MVIIIFFLLKIICNIDVIFASHNSKSSIPILLRAVGTPSKFLDWDEVTAGKQIGDGSTSKVFRGVFFRFIIIILFFFFIMKTLLLLF